MMGIIVYTILGKCEEHFISSKMVCVKPTLKKYKHNDSKLYSKHNKVKQDLKSKYVSYLLIACIYFTCVFKMCLSFVSR